MPSPTQYITFVLQGGTPVRIADQRGAPYPTTGQGALVFSENAFLKNPTIENPTFIDTRPDPLVQTVLNIDALKELTTRPTLVYVRGRVTVGDGGEGYFYWVGGSSVSPNDATSVRPEAGTEDGRYLRIIDDGPIQVAWWGQTWASAVAAWNYCLALDSVHIQFQSGVDYQVTSLLTATGRSVRFDGNGCTFTIMSSYRGRFLWLIGAWEDIQSVVAFDPGGGYIQITDSSVYRRGDVFRVKSDQAMYGATNAAFKQGEFSYVESIDNGQNRLFMREPLFNSYTLPGAQVGRVESHVIDVGNFTLRSQPDSTAFINWSSAITIDTFIYPSVHDVTVTEANATPFYFISCYGGGQKNCVMRSLAAEFTTADEESGSDVRVSYNGNGVTTEFFVDFEFQLDTDLRVYVNGVLQTITTNYTVSGGGGSTGFVTFLVAPPAGIDNVVISRAVNRANGISINNCEGMTFHDIDTYNGQHSVLFIVGSGSAAGGLSGYGWCAHNVVMNCRAYGSDWRAYDTHHMTFNNTFLNCLTQSCGGPGQLRGINNKFTGHQSINDHRGFSTFIQTTYQPLDIASISDNGAGLIRVVSALGSANTYQDGQCVVIDDADPATGADGTWYITKINNTTFDLRDSTYTAPSGAVGRIFRAITDGSQYINCIEDGLISGSAHTTSRRPWNTLIQGGSYIHRYPSTLMINYSSSGPGGLTIKGFYIDVDPHDPLTFTPGDVFRSDNEIAVYDTTIDLSKAPTWANETVFITNSSETIYKINNLNIITKEGALAPINVFRGASASWAIFAPGSQIGDITVTSLTEGFVRGRTIQQVRPFMSGLLYAKEQKMLWLPTDASATNIVTTSATSITLDDTYSGLTLVCTAGTTVTITAPNTLSAGFNLVVFQSGAGQVQYVGGATIRNQDTHTKSFGQYATTCLECVSNADGVSAVALLAGATAA